MATLTIKNLTKRFGAFTAVRNLNLIVNDGEFVCLLGPSGCGKTTILRSIAGLLEPDDGDVLFDGRSVTDVPPERRNAAMVFQNYVLFPHMDVFANVAFGLKMRRRSKSEIEARVGRLLELVHLAGFEKRRPSELSGGQQQRVALARALVTEPSFLLMDEPLANLDTKLRVEMRGFLLSLHRDLPVTTLFVTHDQEEAMMLAERVGVLFDGVLHQYDSPVKVFNQPADQRVADFLLSGVATRIDAGTATIDTPLGELAVWRREELRKGQEVTISIRPQHIQLLPEGLVAEQNVFEATLTDAVFLGGTVQYRAELRGKSLTVVSTSQSVHKSGETVRLYVAPENIWYMRRD